MAIALGTQAVNTDATTSATTHTVTLALNAGELAVLCIAARDTAVISSVVGSANGAYTPAGSVQTNGAVVSAIYYFENSGAGTETVTVTTNANSRMALNLSSWTDAATASALDQVNGANGASGTAHNPGSITTTGAGVIITAYSFSTDEGAFTQTGFTALTAVAAFARDNFGYRIVTGSTTDDGDITITNAATSAARIASFNEPASGSVVGSVIGGKLLGRGVLTGGSLI